MQIISIFAYRYAVASNWIGTRNDTKKIGIKNNLKKTIMKTTNENYEKFLGEFPCHRNLIEKVYSQMGCENEEEFFEQLDNVLNCYDGAAGGFAGFIYYSETCEFWKENKEDIKKLMQEMADDLGETKLSMVMQFNCIKDSYTEDEVGEALFGKYNPDLEGIYNAFAWYALEEVAYFWDSFKSWND